MNAKESSHIIIAIILFAFVISFLQGLETFLWALLIAFLVITVNIIGKQLMAGYLAAKTEYKIWHFQRYGLYERSYFKKPVPIGILLPFLLTILSWGYIPCLTLLQTDITPTLKRVAKKRGGLRRFYEITEWHNAAIPALGIGLNLIIALLILIFIKNINLASQIAKFSIYYAIWNLIPAGQLDGTKILFGSKILWLFLVIISIIFTLITILI